MVLGFIFAFITAIFESTKDLFSKKGLQKVDEYVVAWGLRAFALPFLLPLLLFISLPTLDGYFWYALFIGGGLNVITTILYMKAIKLSDLSITIPMVTFTPLFLLITSPLIVGEFPSVLGIVGICLIVLGAYFLSIKEVRKGLFAPFKVLTREKGPVIMLLVAFIWSITANIDKIGVLHSSPIFWVISTNVFLTATLSPIMFLRSKNTTREISVNIKGLIPVGLFSALALIFQMTAIKLTLVAYVIAIKRASAIFSSLYGFFIFKEAGMKERLLGAVIMVLGVFFITLF
ncbi:MAG: EamA family transporter [Candidatus Aenigmarchaeota archaeon]|nr:EamA family transporter [Candidatus Aenigmarchaeota archaeon]